jgi:hypothetical protein
VRAELYVPPRYRGALAWLTNQSSEALKAIASAIDETDGSRTSILAVLAVPDADVDAEDLLAALLSLTNYRVAQGLNSAGASEALLVALGAEAGPNDVAVVLESPRLLRLAKATDLAISYERVLQSVRILTELRPVFPEETDDPARHALVIHQVEVEAIRNGRVETMQFAATSNDLDQLERQLKRAREKQRRLSEASEAGGMSVLDADRFLR